MHQAERVALAVASWADEKVNVKIDLDWAAIGLNPHEVNISVPKIGFFQEELEDLRLDSVPIEPSKGCIIVISRKL